MRYAWIILLPMGAGLLGGACKPAADMPPAEINLPSDSAAIRHWRPTKAGQTAADLPEGIVVLASAPTDLDDLPALMKKRGGQFASGIKVYVLASGPLLDSPDQVTVRRFWQKDREFHLQIVHTSARLAGTPLLFRNIQWRPVIQLELTIPKALPEGHCTVRATWTAVASLPDGKPYDAEPLKQRAEFRLTARQ